MTTMTRSGLAALVMLLLACFLAGCGTITNLQCADTHDKESPRPGRVFGGVSRDVAWAKRCFDGNPSPDSSGASFKDQVKGAYYLTIDLPFSFIGDTLTLPITCMIALGEEEDSLQLTGDPRGGLQSH
jgi:uncharacterized protein YceK